MDSCEEEAGNCDSPRAGGIRVIGGLEDTRKYKKNEGESTEDGSSKEDPFGWLDSRRRMNPIFVRVLCRD